MIRVVLPAHLRTLAHVDGEVMLELAVPPTLRSVLDELEARYPMLRGTIRDHDSQQRRPFLRLRGRPFPRIAGHASSPRSRRRHRALPHHRRHCRRLALDLPANAEFDSESRCSELPYQMKSSAADA
jgi:molybdopterin converting factor small subunit